MPMLAILVRAFTAYVFLLAAVRLSGNRTVGQAGPFDFVLALIVGDMIDDLLWAEVGAAQFFVGVGALFLTRIGLGIGTLRATVPRGSEREGA